MATPITWQNVQGRSLAEAATPLQYAAQNIGSAFDKLGGVYTDYQTQQQKQIDDADALRVQTFLDRLQGAASPEAIAKLKASGELDAMRAGIVNPKNMALVRGADEARLTAVRSLTEQGQKFGIGQDEFNARSVTDQAMLLAASGNADGVASLFAANPNLPNKAAVQQALVTAQQKAETQRLAVNKDTRESAAAPIENAQTQAATALATAQTADIPIRSGIQNRELLGREYDRVTAQIAENAAKLGKLESGVIGSTDAMGTVITNLGKVVQDKDHLGKLAGYLNTALAAKPEYSKLPAAVVENIALKYSGELGWFGSASSKAIQADLDNAVKNAGDTLGASAASRASLSSTLQQQRLVAEDLMRQANPDLAKRLDAAAASAPGPTPAPAAAQSAEQPRTDTPVVTPGSAQRAESARVQQLAKIERAEKAAGLRKEFTKEVTDYLDNQTTRDREALGDIGSAVGTSALSLGNAFNDIFTLPVRAAGGAANTLLRLPNAFGAGIPYIPDEGGVLSSLTPYSDRQRAQTTGNTAVADAKAMRAAFEKEQAELRAASKKAK